MLASSTTKPAEPARGFFGWNAPSFVVLVTVRLVATLGLLLVATYYLLASVPFAYYHFLQSFEHFSWVPIFIRVHPVVMFAGLLALLATLSEMPAALAPYVRYLAIVGLMTGAWMTVTLFVPALQTFENAAVVSFVPVLLIGVAAVLDLAAHTEPVERSSGRANAMALSGGAAAAGLVAAAAALLHARFGGLVGSGLHPTEFLMAGIASVIGHVGLFVLVAVMLAAIQSIAIRRAWGWRTEASVLGVGVATLIAIVVRRTLLPGLILSDSRATGLSMALGAAVVASWQALLVRRPFPDGRPADALRFTLVPAGYPPRTRRIVAAGGAVALVLLVWIVPRLLLFADWGFTIRKIVVLAAWAASCALALSVRRGWHRGVLAGAAVAVVTAVLLSGDLAAARQPAPAPSPPLDLDLAIERYATIDTSAMVVLDLVEPILADREFFDRLRRTGDLTDDVTLHAVPLRLVPSMTSAGSARPHIFIIVVDSLRPDYLSPYNPAVTFTPAIDAFARDSLVMRNAFTPYTGTALSQPALWAGGLIPRAMYLKPFSAVDNLERLSMTGGYRRFISVDWILSVILDDRSNLVGLDTRIAHPERMDEMYKFDFCSTESELTARLDQQTAPVGPIFFYSQPQNMHIRAFLGDVFPHYEGLRLGSAEFFKPAVGALRRLDTCFGTLVDYLKAHRLYDDSIIVLTSDHGDAYGEGGRWGHAFYVAPEIVRIPLIMHVPDRLRRNRVWNLDAPAFLTDVTPTLYDLLGYQQLRDEEPAGRSLLKRAAGSRSRPRDSFLIQSSYSRIFGVIDANADWLYVANANNIGEQLFSLREGGQRTLRPADRVRYRRWVLEQLARLNAYYVPGAP